MVEGLINGTALITTPIDVLPELGFKDGFNGYVVPFDLDKFDVQKLLDIPQFEYKTTNTKSIKQWRKLLGDTKPTHAYNPHEKVKLRVTQNYRDTNLNRIVNVGEILNIRKERAEIIQSAGYGRIINGEV
jgi:hypothetical protein